MRTALRSVFSCWRILIGMLAFISYSASAQEVIFLPPLTYTVGNTPVTVVTRDFNGNHILDLAVTNSGDDNVSILLGNGDGTFQPQVTYSTGGDHPNGLVSGDFNNNGFLDLAITNFFSDNVTILFGNGDGSFQAPVLYPVEHLPQTLATGDFNGNGFLDLAVPNSGSNTVSILINNGDGTFQPAVNYPTGLSPQTVAVGDFRDIGILDLAIANQNSNTVRILFGNGDGTFGNPTDYPVDINPDSVAIGRFRGIGAPLDLATANVNSGTVSVLLGNGDGTFNLPATNYPVGEGPQRLKVSDMNGDLIPDILTPNKSENTISLLLGRGDGTFEPAITYAALLSAPDSITVGDFNRDGFPDLAIANTANNTLSILLQQGSAPIATTIRPSTGPSIGGQTVTIRGNNFLGTVSVLFDNIPATFQVISNRRIRVTIPPHEPGTVPVTVTNAYGTSNSLSFTYRQFTPPTIPPIANTIRPRIGPVIGGQTVIIRGNHFFGTLSVLFGNTPVAFEVLSNRTIRVTTPPHEPGTVPVTITNAYGTSNPLSFTYRRFSPSVFPPSSARGFQTCRIFATQTDIVNVLKWKAPRIGAPPIAYQIYRDIDLTQFIASIPANAPLIFKDHNRKPHRTYTYFIVSVDAEFLTSKPITLKVEP